MLSRLLLDCTTCYNLLYKDTVELQALCLANDGMVEVVYKVIDETDPVHP